MLSVDALISAYVPPFRFVRVFSVTIWKLTPRLRCVFLLSLPLSILQYVVVSSWFVHYSIHDVRHPSTPLASFTLAFPHRLPILARGHGSLLHVKENP